MRIKKILIIALATVLFCMTAVSAAGRKAHSAVKTEKTSVEAPDTLITSGIPFNNSISAIALAKKMECGWNLGNTLDARDNWTKTFPLNQGLGSETVWGEVTTTEKIIRTGMDNGYKTIRIPVTWCNHIIDNNYTIDPVWMRRVKQVVDWAIDAGYYVILNEHHSVQDKMSKPLKHCEGYIVRKSDEKESRAFLEAVWKQIAASFNNEYDEHLIFETMNEPRNTDHVHCWAPQPDKCSECKADLEIVSGYNQLILDTVRASGGNNAYRFVMIPAIGTSVQNALSDYFKLPADSAEDKLMVTVHQYPLDSGGTGNDSHHFDTSVKSKLLQEVKALNEKFVSKGIPVVIGECGAARKGKNWATGELIKDYVVTYQDRLDCFSFYAGLAGKYSMPFINWDCGGTDGSATIDRKTCTLYEPDYVPAVIKAWKDAEERPETVLANLEHEDLNLDELKVWQKDASSYDKKKRLLMLGNGWKGADIWFGIKDLSDYSMLTLTYKNASADFVFYISYTDNTEERVNASASSSKAVIKIDRSKKAAQVCFMSHNQKVSVTIDKITFSAR